MTIVQFTQNALAIFVSAIAVALPALKLAGLHQLSWWWAMSPALMLYAVIAFVGCALVIVRVGARTLSYFIPALRHSPNWR